MFPRRRAPERTTSVVIGERHDPYGAVWGVLVTLSCPRPPAQYAARAAAAGSSPPFSPTSRAAAVWSHPPRKETTSAWSPLPCGDDAGSATWPSIAARRRRVGRDVPRRGGAAVPQSRRGG